MIFRGGDPHFVHKGQFQISEVLPTLFDKTIGIIGQKRIVSLLGNAMALQNRIPKHLWYLT